MRNHRARADEHFGAAFGDAANGFLRGGGAECDFHHIDAALQQRIGGWNRVLRAIEYDDGNNAAGVNAFKCVHHEASFRFF